MKKLIKKMISVVMIAFMLINTGCSSNNLKKVDASTIIAKDFSQNISTDNMIRNISVLSAKDNARITGFDGEKNMALYIAKQFEEIGLKVEKQSFPVKSFRCDFAEIKIMDGSNKTITPKALTFSAATPKSGIISQVIFADKGTSEIIDKMDLKDKIVLMTRGGEYFRVKTENAAKKGALAVLFYDTNSEDAVSATLVEPSNIPSASITRSEGEYIKSLLDSGENVKISLKLDSIINDSQSENIIGTLNANKSDKNTKTIVVGAHYDGVDTPAANDNASGTAAMLEIARALSKEKLNCNIKFIAFGAEETGCIGSYNYVQSLSSFELRNVIAMMNLDMVGVGDKLFIHTLNQNTKSNAADIAEEITKKLGYEYIRNAQEGSDHAAFEQAGVSVAYFEYGEDTNYHTDRDTIEKIQKEDLSNTCNVVASTVFEMAKNPERYAVSQLQ